MGPGEVTSAKAVDAMLGEGAVRARGSTWVVADVWVCTDPFVGAEPPVRDTPPGRLFAVATQASSCALAAL
jgi:hypothetical protein